MEFWFEFGSNYSYLSVMRIEELAAKRSVPVAWRPFLLGPIFKSLGWENSPFVLQPAKGAYMWRDMLRQCAWYGLPWNRPSAFPRRALLPMRVALVGAEQPWMGRFCREIMLLNFRDDRDIDAPAPVTEVCSTISACRPARSSPTRSRARTRRCSGSRRSLPPGAASSAHRPFSSARKCSGGMTG